MAVVPLRLLDGDLPTEELDRALDPRVLSRPLEAQEARDAAALALPQHLGDAAVPELATHLRPGTHGSHDPLRARGVKRAPRSLTPP